MNLLRDIFATSLLVCCSLLGCASPSQISPDSDTPERVEARLGHGYSILFDLLGKEAMVGDILVIKKASDSTAALLKDISATSARARNTIESMRAGAPPLDLTMTGLPSVETEARNRIANAQTRTLLTAFDSFELKILLTQQSACEYAWALATSLAAVDPNEARSKTMSLIAKEFEALRERAVTMLALASQARASSNEARPSTISPDHTHADVRREAEGRHASPGRT